MKLHNHSTILLKIHGLIRDYLWRTNPRHHTAFVNPYHTTFVKCYIAVFQLHPQENFVPPSQISQPSARGSMSRPSGRCAVPKALRLASLFPSFPFFPPFPSIQKIIARFVHIVKTYVPSVLLSKIKPHAVKPYVHLKAAATKKAAAAIMFSFIIMMMLGRTNYFSRGNATTGQPWSCSCVTFRS